MILVTGGAGFIGSNFILDWLRYEEDTVLNLDKLTYAGNPNNLAELGSEPRYRFVHGDICDAALIAQLLQQHRPRAIIHFAAESHVDRSIHGPAEFITTNVNGSFTLLEAARAHWDGLPSDERAAFRFIHISTDEVYGSLGPDDEPFSESHAHRPNSPYSASKAAADHLARAYFHTYGLPVVTTNCSNNYGPLQFPEKLIPLTILNALAGQALPIYGDGQNVRDWLYVSDHCSALRTVLARGKPGETYNIGGGYEAPNLEIVQNICSLLDTLKPDRHRGPHAQLITFVADRPGHDRRYAIDSRKINRQLAWVPIESFEFGLRKTVEWYLENHEWVRKVQTGEYRQWLARQYSSATREINERGTDAS